VNEHSHTTAPAAIPAILLYGLSDSLTYHLRRIAEEWVLSELTMDVPAGGGVRLYAGAAVIPTPVVLVDAGADLRTAEPGAVTTVTKVEAS
jgi:hypothetical protein